MCMKNDIPKCIEKEIKKERKYRRVKESFFYFLVVQGIRTHKVRVEEILINRH